MTHLRCIRCTASGVPINHDGLCECCGDPDVLLARVRELVSQPIDEDEADAAERYWLERHARMLR